MKPVLRERKLKLGPERSFVGASCLQGVFEKVMYHIVDMSIDFVQQRESKLLNVTWW